MDRQAFIDGVVATKILARPTGCPSALPDKPTRFRDRYCLVHFQLGVLRRRRSHRSQADAQAGHAYFKLSENILDISRKLQTDKAVTLILNDSRNLFQEVNNDAQALSDNLLTNSHVASRQSDAMYERSRMIGIGMTLAAIFIAVLLTVLTVRNTIRQLGKDPGELNAIARRVVDGDYNIDDGGKKMGVYGSIVEMVNALKRNIENSQRESENAKEQSARAREAMEQAEAASKEAQSKTEAMLVAADKLETVGSVVSSASTQLSAQIEQSDRGAAESAQRLSEAATAMNEMNATVQEVAKNGFRASAASAETKQKAEAGAEVVAKAVQSIEQVHQMSLNSRGIWFSSTSTPRISSDEKGLANGRSRTSRTRPTCWPSTRPSRPPARRANCRARFRCGGR